MAGRERFLVGRVFEEVGAIVEEEGVAVIEEPVDVATVIHEIPVDRVEIIQVSRVHVLFDKGIQRLDDALSNHVGHPRGNHVEHIEPAGRRDVLLHHRRKELVKWLLDDIDRNPGQLLPFRTGKVLRAFGHQR